MNTENNVASSSFRYPAAGIVIPNDLASLLTWEIVMPFTRTQISQSWIAYPQSVADCRRIIDFCKNNHFTLCPQGSGYTYGDEILNDGGVIINTKKFNRILSWNADTGKICVEPGVQLIDIFKTSLPDGWAPLACPGGAEITVGGAVANNVHGKDAWKAGGFCNQVVSLKMLKDSGEEIVVNPSDNKYLFNVICGGMGLLGVITEITLQLTRIPSPVIESKIITANNAETLLNKMESLKSESDFMVGWMDWTATGKNTGRGLISVGNWVKEGKIITKEAILNSVNSIKNTVEFPPKKGMWMLFNPFGNTTTTGLFNRINYHTHRLLFQKTKKRELYTDYNFWTGKMPHTRDFCTKSGYMENQVMFPRATAARDFFDIIKLCQKEGYYPIMSVVKAHRPDENFISFSGDTFSMTIEWNLKGRLFSEVKRFASQLLDEVAKRGGKAYLAKDQVLNSEQFSRMYPHRQQYMEVKKQLNPDGLFASDMYRRLLLP